MRKIFKIITILCIVSLLSLYMVNISSAVWEGDEAAKALITKDASNDGGVTAKAQTIVKSIITITRTIAAGVAVIMLAVVAMKYMMAAPGDRAEIKKHAVVYVVGAVVLFATSGLLTIIEGFAAKLGT